MINNFIRTAESLICHNCQNVKDKPNDICKACGFNPKTGEIEKYWSLDGLSFPYKDTEEEPYPPYTPPFTSSGWVCPKCGSVYAPHVSTCWRCSGNHYKPFEVWC